MIHNTTTSYGFMARVLHWLTALLIITTIPLGLTANSVTATDPESVAQQVQLFSLHKTLGVATFFVALLRILWALTQPRPAPIHPGRWLENRLAELVHWLLYISLLAVPLSGWTHHAALDGFAPILWPLGQDLPFMPKSETIAAIAGTMHWLFGKILFVSILLHLLGALKHLAIDRDGTFSRMVTGSKAGGNAAHPRGPAVVAVVLYIAGTMVALWITPAATQTTALPAATTDQAPATLMAGGNWQVQQGSLNIAVKQMGTNVGGSFAAWSAQINFDETPVDGKNGTVDVMINMASLTLGAVTSQASGPEFLDTATHPTARFTADLTANGADYEARGTLSLHGVNKPMTLPFTLMIAGDTATMIGETTLDRRDFGIGARYTDEKTVNFAVAIKVTLTAKRQ